MSGEENIEGGEVREEMGLQDGTRKKSVDLVAWGKWAMGTTTVHVCKVGMGGGIVVVGGQRAALTAKTKEGRGSREGGVGLEPESGGEEIGTSKVGGDEGGVCLTAADTWEGRMVGR